MIKHKDHFHGSDLEAIEKCYHIKKEDIISFSANVNPLGISYQLRSTLADNLDAITTYPDREYTALRTCIATNAAGKCDCRKWFHRTDFSVYSDEAPEKSTGTWSYVFGV